jgi:hypothetical protein
MAVLRNGSKCSHTTCMLRFITVSRLALNPNLFFEIGSSFLYRNGPFSDTYNTSSHRRAAESAENVFFLLSADPG